MFQLILYAEKICNNAIKNINLTFSYFILGDSMFERATKKIVIDAGHGGSDPGTSGNGIVEKDYTLKISEYMKNRFDELGIESSLTRTDDSTLSPSDRPKKAQSFYGTGNDVILISNHINAGGGDGSEVIYSLRNSDNLSRRIASEIAKTGQNVRKYYQRRLPSNPSKDYYYILRDTPNNESIIVEYGFVDSTLDDVSQLKNDWEELAEAVVKAVAEYIGAPYTINENINYYKVKSGDTLWSIARDNGITVNELKTANNLTSNALTIGQLLYIPKEETEIIETEIYTVKSGDTLYSIARKYNLTVDELKKLNNLTSNSLSIGQKLNISSTPKDSETTYTVSKGDTLYGIAYKFGVSVNNIKDINNLFSNTLSIGQILKIPSTSSNKVTYTVKKGDTLYSIAKTYNTSVDKIKSLNNLTSNSLSIGQTLILPS